MVLSSLCLSAQTVDIHLPRHPYKKLTVIVKNGIANDTIYHDSMDDKGRAKIMIPEQHRGYRGIATLKTGDYAIFDFILAGEDFTLTCKEDYPHGGNVSFTNSPENESLQKWFYEQHTRQEKIGALGEVLRLYPEEEAFHSPLKVEKQGLDKQQQKFETMLAKSELYAAQFIRLRNFLGAKVGSLVMADKEQMTAVRSYVRDSLDVNSLYTSGMWFEVLNGMLALYDNQAPFHKDYISDMSVLLDRTANEKIYTTLAENIFAICQSTAWHQHEDQLANYLINGRRINEPTGKLKSLFALFKLSKGSPAPSLTQTKLPKKKTILAFYDSGCGSCTGQMKQLVEHYPEIQKKGYDVISISADFDKAVFERLAKTYPWREKLCDYQGFAGKDFLNYGVMGTPTFYLINGKGIVDGIYARVEDIKL